MNKPRPVPKSVAPPDAHEENHFLLRQLLDALEAAGTGHGRALCLDALHGFLKSHFAAEEAPGGFFDAIAGHAPWLADRVVTLRAEHGAFLSSIDFIGARLRQRGPEVIATEIAELVALMRAHEIAEGVLYQEAMSG